MNLVLLSHHPYHLNFRRYLGRAAALAGAKVASVEWSRGAKVIINEQLVATFPPWTSAKTVSNKVYDLIGREPTLIFDGMGTKLNSISFFFQKPTANSYRIYDVFDDFRYNSRGLRRMKFYVMDFLLRIWCDKIFVLSEDILELYQDAVCVDVGTHLTTIPNIGEVDPTCIVYAGSIDQRTDFDLIAEIAESNPELQIDLYGQVLGVQQLVDNLVANHDNVRHFGLFNDDDLCEILSNYRIGFLPYKVDHSMTKYISSAKLYHYLNSGLEVISTPFPHAAKHAKFIHLITSSDQWQQAYKSALLAPRASCWPYQDFLWSTRWCQYLGIMGNQAR